MANTNAPFGFRPVRRIDGAAPNYTANPYQILYTTTNKMGTGDVVKLSTGGGYIDIAGTTDNPVLGVFMGCEYYDTYLQRKVWSPQWVGPSTAIAPVTAYVIDDKQVVFEAQSSGTAIAQLDIGANIKFTGNGTPNALSGISIAALDQTQINVTATFPFRIIGLSQKVGNDNTSSYNIAEVVLNAPALMSTTGI